MSSTTVSDSQRLAANPAEELLAAHVSQLRDGEPHTHKSIFFSGSLRFTPSDGPSRFTNLSFLDAWGKEPDASEMPFRQGTSASVLLNAAFVKVLVESSGERGLVGFVIPVGRGIPEECQETSLRSVITLSMISERGYCSELWTNCSITAGTPDEADDTPFTGGNGTLHLPEDIASAVGTDSIPLCLERRFLLVLPDSLSEEMPQPSLPLVAPFWSAHSGTRTDRWVLPRLSLFVTSRRRQ